jgi:hypothetical protein
VASYRHELRRLADLPLFTRSFVRLDVDRLAAETAGPLSEQVARSAKRARHRTGDRALPPLTHEVAGERKIVEERPLITRLPAPDAELLAEALDEYLETLPSYWRRVLGGYTLVDVAHKVVGVGSVGVRAYVALLEGSSEEDVVFLHLKQARRAVLGRYVHGESAWHAHQRQRVVQYQQSSQTVSDPLLGGPRWTACRVGGENEDVVGRIECVDISMGRVSAGGTFPPPPTSLCIARAYILDGVQSADLVASPDHGSA